MMLIESKVSGRPDMCVAYLQKMVASPLGRKRAREAVLLASSSTFGFQISALDRGLFLLGLK
jgi:hypothetical protein